MIGPVTQLAQVDNVRPAIGHLSAAVIEDESPGEVAAFLRVGRLGAVAQPHVVVEALGDRHGGVDGRVVPHGHVVPLVAGQVDLDGVQLSNPTVADQFAGEARVGPRSLVASGLEHPPVPPDRVVDGFSFGDGVGQRFLAVDVLTGSGGRYRRQTVPVIRRADRNGVDGIVGQQLTEVVELGAILVFVLRVDDSRGAIAVVGVDVADRDHLHVAPIEECPHIARTLPAHADAAHYDPFAGRHRSAGAARRRWNDRRQARDTRGRNRHALDKVPPTDLFRVLHVHAPLLIAA